MKTTLETTGPEAQRDKLKQQPLETERKEETPEENEKTTGKSEPLSVTQRLWSWIWPVEIPAGVGALSRAEPLEREEMYDDADEEKGGGEERVDGPAVVVTRAEAKNQPPQEPSPRASERNTRVRGAIEQIRSWLASSPTVSPGGGRWREDCASPILRAQRMAQRSARERERLEGMRVHQLEESEREAFREAELDAHASSAASDVVDMAMERALSRVLRNLDLDRDDNEGQSMNAPLVPSTTTTTTTCLGREFAARFSTIRPLRAAPCGGLPPQKEEDPMECCPRCDQAIDGILCCAGCARPLCPRCARRCFCISPASPFPFTTPRCDACGFGHRCNQQNGGGGVGIGYGFGAAPGGFLSTAAACLPSTVFSRFPGWTQQQPQFPAAAATAPRYQHQQQMPVPVAPFVPTASSSSWASLLFDARRRNSQVAPEAMRSLTSIEDEILSGRSGDRELDRRHPRSWRDAVLVSGAAGSFERADGPANERIWKRHRTNETGQ